MLIELTGNLGFSVLIPRWYRRDATGHGMIEGRLPLTCQLYFNTLPIGDVRVEHGKAMGYKKPSIFAILPHLIQQPLRACSCSSSAPLTVYSVNGDNIQVSEWL